MLSLSLHVLKSPGKLEMISISNCAGIAELALSKALEKGICVACGLDRTKITFIIILLNEIGSSVYMGILAQPFYPIFPDFSKLGPLFKTS